MNKKMSLEFTHKKEQKTYDKLVRQLGARLHKVQETRSDLMKFLAKNKPVDSDGVLEQVEREIQSLRPKKSLKKSSSRSSSSKKVIIPLTKGGMKISGEDGAEYHIRFPERKRRQILNRLVLEKEKSAIKVFRALIARRTVGKNKLSQQQIKRLTDDAEYLKSKYFGKPIWNPK